MTNELQRVRGVVADIERAATPKGRAGVGCYVVEGIRLHERAVRAGARVERAIVAAAALRQPSPRLSSVLDAIVAAGGEWLTAADDVVARLTGDRAAAIVGLVRLPEDADLRAVFASAPRAVVLVAVEVEDPGNVGALLRTALAAGAAGFVAVGISDPFHPKAVRTSMGAVCKLPIGRFDSAGECRAALVGTGAHVVGAVSRDGTPLPLYRTPPGGPVAVLLGGEAFGLDPSVVAGLDGRVTIPQSSEVDSYSVNAAAAILLYSLRVAPDDPKP